MMTTDPIADMLTRIRNGYAAHKHEITLPYSKLKHAVAEILVQERFITSIEKVAEGKAGFPDLKIRLKYEQGRPAITAIDRWSKPGHRVYKKSEEIPTIQSGYGIAILSTSQGVMTNKKAKSLGIGGEIVCKVW